MENRKRFTTRFTTLFTTAEFTTKSSRVIIRATPKGAPARTLSYFFLKRASRSEFMDEKSPEGWLPGSIERSRATFDLRGLVSRCL